MILGWLFHAIYATCTAYVLANIFGSLTPFIAGFSLVVGSLFGFRHARKLIATHPEFRLLSFAPGEAGVVEWLIFAFVTYASWRHFMWMLYPQDLSWATLSANNFGDLPMHINFIRGLASGIEFPVRNPIFASELLRYPFGPDLYNALWEAIGVRLPAHLFFTGLCASLISLILLRAYGGWWAMGAFFFSGSLAGWQILQGAGLKDYQPTVDWKNLFLTVFITQRGMLFALPLGLLLLKCVRDHVSGVKLLRFGQLLVLGGLWGFLPLFHLHAFIVVSVMLAGIYFEYGGLKAVGRSLRSPMAIVAYLPAIFFVLYSTDFLRRSGGIVRFSWGWTSGTYPMFYLENFGPWLLIPLVTAAAINFSRSLFKNEERRRLWFEFGFYSLLFVFFFNVMLAPWEWDNIKVLIWPYLGFARLLYISLEPRLGVLLGAVERPLIGVVLFFSGFTAIVWSLQSPVGRSVSLYQVGELANVQGALANVPVNAVFAASPTHQHPLTYFGRLRAMGYEGHLWSHGIDAGPMRTKLEAIMHDDPDFVRLAREAGITHIFWGPDERLRYGDKPRSWMQTLPNVSRVPGYEIYAVK